MPTQKQRKLAIMGSRGVGKSTIIHQFVDKQFVNEYNPTIENTFHKLIKYRENEYNTEILDTAGQDEYSIFHTQYSIGIHGYLLVYSVANKGSFELIKTLNDKILNACGTEKVPRVLLGNKCDLDKERQISTQEGLATAAEWSCGFVESSAKLNSNIDDAFIKLIVEVEKSSSPDPVEEKKCCIL
eukprot:TRINITY_DN13121_c0_g1_i1.p1 TRINITY_DN13121_c0_g1~~TRINITY_DN13121_c0_g1_i1.p1  ORF type:complete len:185 (-),score=31.11 TRINITY_DN13121_c0_g1_i1:69-623(-)